jgi:archaellum biogenesis ATPase FlaH
MKSTTGCKTQLYGAYKTRKLKKDGTVYVYEGEFDCIVMSWMLKQVKKKNTATIGVPGAGIFKAEWRNIFRNKNVILCYDHDPAGQSGILRAYENLYNIASTIKALIWPDKFKASYDVRDFYRDHRNKKLTSPQIFKKLVRYIQPIDSYIDNLQDEVDFPKKHTPALISLSDVESEEVEWMWENRILLGKLSIIADDLGLGKSFLTLYIAACVSKGKPLPDTSAPVQTGSVILLSAEDGLADTIRPRLDAAGADVSKIFALKGIVISNENFLKEFELTKDLEGLEQAIQKPNDVRLVVIDPITAYMGNTDSHKNADVRRVLAPLATISEKYKVAVIAVTHLNKKDSQKTIYRTMGSLAFVAAARSVWLVIKNKGDNDKRLLLPCKTNLSRNATGLAFSIINGAVEFDEDPFDVDSLDDLKNDSSPMNTAVTFLKDILKDGSMESKKVTWKAAKKNTSPSTLKRAKKKLNVIATKKGGKKFGNWYWRLPEEDA